jgi:hypothetical protein
VITPTSEGANVTIYRRSGTEDWAQLTVVKANATGGYAYNWTPEMSGSFELKANWAGDATTLAAESSVTTLTVNKVGSEISLNVDPSSVVLGGDATITGSISPRHTGVNVTISYRLTGEQWSELTMTKTDSNSQYAFTWNTFRVGTFEIKASWLGDENTLPAESSISSLTVNKVASEISLNVNPQNVTFGSDVTMSGAISPERTGVNVAISYRPAGGQWSELAIVETDSNGLYAFTWKPLQTGRFEFKANWSGDENTLQTESDVRSVTVEGQSNVFLYVVVAVIGIIAAALILYYWRTRKSKQGTGQT